MNQFNVYHGSAWGKKNTPPQKHHPRRGAPAVSRLLLFTAFTLLVTLPVTPVVLRAQAPDGSETEELTAISDYVEVFEGDMPLLFAVGHGGWKQVGTLKNGGYAADVLLRDYFYEILMVRLYEKTGHLPYVVYQQGNRDYVNTNRPVDHPEAYHPDNSAARQAYFEFHNQVDEMIGQLEAVYGENMGLMINPHTTDLSAGIGGRPWDRIADIGFVTSVTNLDSTRNTMKALYDRRGEVALRGQDSIPYQLFHGQHWPSAAAIWPAAATSNSKTLARSGNDVWHVLPAWVTGWVTDDWVTAYFNGFSTVSYHGSNTSGHHANWSNGLDAFQIEVNYTKGSGIARNQSGPHVLDVPFTTALMNDFADAIIHGLAENYNWTPGDAYNVIVDNGGSGFSTTGSWEGSCGEGYWGTQSIYTDESGVTATWTPDLTRAGLYEVFVRWTESGERTHDARYTVYDVDGAHTITVDQDAGSDAKWISLGEFRFATGTEGSVVLRTTATGETTSADAVLFRLLFRNQVPTAAFSATPALGDAPLRVSFDGSASTDDDGSIERYYWQFDDGATAWGQAVHHTFDNAGDYHVKLRVTDDGGAKDPFTVVVGVGLAATDTVVTIDNTDDGFSTTGTWIESEADFEYAGSSIYAMADGATATWTPYLPQAGRYIVLVWPTYWSTRARNAPYTIRHARGSSTVRLNQRDNSGQWVALGVYEFKAGTAIVQNVKVTREAGDGTSTCADAVRFLLVGGENFLPLTLKTR
jgi:PKD repeat protein